MQLKEKYGPWAVIAGAAEGLGEAWSKALAGKGMNLIMVDHQEDKLTSLAKALKEEYKINTVPLLTDLSDPNAPNQIMDKVSEHACRLLIYNAAFSKVKPFLQHTIDEIEMFTEINIRTQLKLVYGFSNMLKVAGTGGGIILMSSLAGLLGMQLVAPYAATKAFAWNLSEALHHELKPINIDVMACIAGATSTPAYLKTNPKYGNIRPQVMAPEAVAEEALKKLGKKAIHITGRSNRLNYFILTRMLPRKMAARIANNTMKKMYS